MAITFSRILRRQIGNMFVTLRFYRVTLTALVVVLMHMTLNTARATQLLRVTMKDENTPIVEHKFSWVYIPK